METLETIRAQLAALGVSPGATVMVHSSLRRIGYVLGGAPTCVRALIDILGPEGTLVMPAFSPAVSDPSAWSEPAIGAGLVEVARRHVPAFDPETTPTTMGAIPEAFRNWPGSERSAHPQVSVIARGPRAAAITVPHTLEWGQGAGSPFERMYELDVEVLLLGVGFNRATMLHYAESLVPHGRRKRRRIPIDGPEGRHWSEVDDVGDDLDTHFPEIGTIVAREGLAVSGMIGTAPTIRISARTLVDRAVRHLSEALQNSP
ncbi:MAG: AAC(3) family N-acetyltransferase [Actinomycetota bacterium]